MSTNHRSNSISIPLFSSDDCFLGNNPCPCDDPDCKYRNNRHHYRSLLSSSIKQSLKNPYNPIPFPSPLLSDLIELIAEYCEDDADIGERSMRGAHSTFVAFVNQCRPDKKIIDDEKQKKEKEKEKNNTPMTNPSPPLIGDASAIPLIGLDSCSSKKESAVITPLLQNNNDSSSSSANTVDDETNNTTITITNNNNNNNSNDNNNTTEEKNTTSTAPPSPPSCWDGSVDIYWLNYEGIRIRYHHLLSGSQYIQQTYYTHPWLALRSNDNQRLLINGQYLFYPPMPNSGKPCVAVINEPPPPNEKKWMKERNGCALSCDCKCHHDHHHH